MNTKFWVKDHHNVTILKSWDCVDTKGTYNTALWRKQYAVTLILLGEGLVLFSHLNPRAKSFSRTTQRPFPVLLALMGAQRTMPDPQRDSKSGLRTKIEGYFRRSLMPPNLSGQGTPECYLWARCGPEMGNLKSFRLPPKRMNPAVEICAK